MGFRWGEPWSIEFFPPKRTALSWLSAESRKRDIFRRWRSVSAIFPPCISPWNPRTFRGLTEFDGSLSAFNGSALGESPIELRSAPPKSGAFLQTTICLGLSSRVDDDVNGISRRSAGNSPPGVPAKGVVLVGMDIRIGGDLDDQPASRVVHVGLFHPRCLQGCPYDVVFLIGNVRVSTAIVCQPFPIFRPFHQLAGGAAPQQKQKGSGDDHSLTKGQVLTSCPWAFPSSRESFVDRHGLSAFIMRFSPAFYSMLWGVRSEISFLVRVLRGPDGKFHHCRSFFLGNCR